MEIIKDLIKKAKQGESVYISEIRDAFIDAGTAVGCTIETAAGEMHQWMIPLPYAGDKEDKDFISDYFYSDIYNIIATFGGKYMVLNISQLNDQIEELCAALNNVFQINTPRSDRTGMGMILNVTDRVNASLGFPPFYFKITRDIQNNDVKKNEVISHTDAAAAFTETVSKACEATLIGLDIGGTDIKAVGVLNGRILSLKEYDWNPAGMTRTEQLTGEIINIVKMICSELGDNILLDGIGVGFPDVVIMNKIVGGETLKTRSIRLASSDYEAEFAKFLKFNDILLKFCKPGAAVNITNDGFLAAYTAAVELAHSNRADEIKNGVLAHTLGTELGTGWIDENGDIPQIPLEVYTCVIDMGNYPARKFRPTDLRSTLNLNNDLAGTMQKYACQSGAYRLALDYFKTGAPELYDELFTKGFIEEKDGMICIISAPEDMRKPLLSHIMNLADEGKPQAERIFREIGRYLAATWRETEFLLSPKVKNRILYGRFVKSAKCMKLMKEGANELSGISLEAGDDSLAFTPLMKALKDDPNYTVAQFGQAIGAVYYAAKGMV